MHYLENHMDNGWKTQNDNMQNTYKSLLLYTYLVIKRRRMHCWFYKMRKSVNRLTCKRKDRLLGHATFLHRVEKLQHWLRWIDTLSSTNPPVVFAIIHRSHHLRQTHFSKITNRIINIAFQPQFFVRKHTHLKRTS